MVNGTNGTDRTAPKVGTSRCPACGIRGRPSGPSLPESVRCPRFSVRSSDMLKHGHHTLWLSELCLGCRRRLPSTAAVLCAFQGFFDQVFHLVSACFTWFQLSGKKIGTGEAENLRFRLRGTDAQQVFADCQCPYHARFTYGSALRGIFTRLVAGCCTWLQLVAACCSYREKIRRGICEARNLELAMGSAIRKAPNTNIQALENVQMPITKRPPCKRASVLALGNWCFNGAWMLAFGASWQFLPFGRIFVPYLFQASQAFHLVSPGCTYTTLKHDKTRYF